MANVLDLQTIGDIFLLVVDGNPALAAGTTLPNGDDVPPGSMAFEGGALGLAYIKSTAGATNWKLLDLSENDWSLAGNLLTGVSPDTPNEFIGSLNAFDVVFRRNNVEAFRIVESNQGPSIQQGTSSPDIEWNRLTTTDNRFISRVIQAYNVNGRRATFSEITRTLRTTSNVVSPIYNLATQDDTCIRLKMEFLVRASVGGTEGNISTYERVLTARNVAGILTIRQFSSPQTHEDDPALNITATINGASQLAINVVGINSRSHDWFMMGQLLVTD